MDNKKLIHDTVVATLAALNNQPKPQDFYKATEARLYAYPVLLENIKRYKLDIRDLKKEKNTEKSKDITCWGGASGIRLTPEEKQAAKIMAVEIKLERDTAEVNRINKALLRLKRMNSEEDVAFIKRLYFQGLDLAGLAEFMGESLATIQRRRTRLVRQLALMLYGAEALI
ncbi:hypothetical protein [Phascolarctobacterium succinatutens]